MADVTVVAPSGQVQNVGGAQSSSGGGPALHSALPPGSLVSGTITGRDASGNYLLKSSQGTFTLQSATPLTYNSDVTIRLGANAGGAGARIVSVNGESFADFSAPQADEADSVSGALLTGGPTETQSSAPLQASGVRAVITSAPPPSGAPAENTLAEGNTVLLRISAPGDSVQTGQSQTTDAQGAALPTGIATSAAAATAPEQVAQSAQPPAQVQNPLPASPPPAAGAASGLQTAATTTTAAPVETELASSQTVTQSAQSGTAGNQASSAPAQASASPPQEIADPTVAPQAAAEPSLPSAALYSAYTRQAPSAALPPAAAEMASAPSSGSPVTIPAQVVSADNTGTLTLQTPQGTISVQAPSAPALSSLPAGTALTLEILTPAATEPAAEAPAPAGIGELAGSWQSLKAIADPSASTDASISAVVLSRLPALGSGFVSESLAFIGAMIQGDSRKLLGDDTLDALRQNGRADLAEKFSAEVSTLSASYNAPATREQTGWQTLLLPFVFQEALQQARIYVKRETPKKERPGKSPAETRFVVEVDLSEMGPLQMDGLIRTKEKTLAFDLILRSHHPFSASEQSEILALYTEAGELTGFKGSLAFQVTKDFPVKPLENLPHEIPPDMVV